MAGAGNFCLRHRVQTASGAHTASYSGGTGGFTPCVKRSGRESDRSCHLPPMLRMRGATSLHGVVLS